jgi:hypothetical protein
MMNMLKNYQPFKDKQQNQKTINNIINYIPGLRSVVLDYEN